MKKLLLLAAAFAAATTWGETKVGVIGLDTSHTIAFTKLMNVTKDPGCAGFRMTTYYKWGSRDIVSSTNRYPKYEKEMQEMGVKPVDSIAELLKEVDCVLLETNDGREHFKQAEEVFKSGKPVFIDKPIAHNLADAAKIVDLGKKMNARFFSSSALRYGSNTQAAVQGKFGKIRSCDYYTPFSIEATHGRYPWYAIHGFEPLFAVMGKGAQTVTCTRCGDDDLVAITWADGRVGTVRCMQKQWLYGGRVIPYKGKAAELSGYEGYMPLLAQIVKFFQTGVVPIDPEETLDIFAAMEAAELSLKRGGVPVTIREVLDAARDAQ